MKIKTLEGNAYLKSFMQSLIETKSGICIDRWAVLFQLYDYLEEPRMN